MDTNNLRLADTHFDASAKAGRAGIATLWITGPSVALRQRLLAIRALPSMSIICPEADCSNAVLSNQTIEWITRYIVERGIVCVVVCGEADDLCSGAADSRDSKQTGPFSRMLQRIVDHSARRRRVQDRVRTWLQQIRSHERISALSRKRRIRLMGIFYARECDAFLVHDRGTDQFVPLLETLSGDRD